MKNAIKVHYGKCMVQGCWSLTYNSKVVITTSDAELNLVLTNIYLLSMSLCSLADTLSTFPEANSRYAWYV